MKANRDTIGLSNLFYFTLTLFLLSGCSTPLTNIKPDQPLKMAEGIFVIRFHPTYEGLTRLSNKDLRISIREAEKTFPDWKIEITSPDSLKVVTLPAGKYQWHMLHLANKYLAFSEDSSFVVQDGKMIYLGDIYIHSYSRFISFRCKIAVKDKYEEVLKLLNEEYPSIVRKYGLSKSLTTIKHD